MNSSVQLWLPALPLRAARPPVDRWEHRARGEQGQSLNTGLKHWKDEGFWNYELGGTNLDWSPTAFSIAPQRLAIVVIQHQGHPFEIRI